MVRYVDLKMFDEFSNYIERLDPNGPPVFIFFSGWSGWCPDSVEAQSVVKACLSELQKFVIFISVDIDSRKYWKKPSCPYRTDNRCKLTVIPTLINWKGGQRLEGNQCKNRDRLQMMFEEEE
ncbi:hypothetical protein evm_012118 [Chilo suppressalis]|nr:hypothetical protein evm_012118 [Chilo suppressalis]